MSSINAYLCFGCKFILNDFFDVSPLYQTAPPDEVCPWCQKNHALMKFELTEKQKVNI